MLLNIVSGILYADHNIFHNNDNIIIVPMIEVIDGDTIRTSISLPSPLNKLSIRIKGMNTPESTWRAKCPEERVLGIAAKEFLKKYLKSESIMVLSNFKYGTYAGRIVSDVSVNGVDIGDLMIQKGYGRYYDGKTKGSWCN